MINSYIASSTPNLIDINKDITNFSAQFRIISDEKQPIHFKIVSQDELNTVNIEKMSLTTIQDSYEGAIKVNDNIYQNYFIMLLASKPTKVSIEINITVLPTIVKNKTKLDKAVVKTVEKEENEDNSKYLYVLIGSIILLITLLYNKFNINKTPSLLNQLKDISFK